MLKLILNVVTTFSLPLCRSLLRSGGDEVSLIDCVAMDTFDQHLNVFLLSWQGLRNLPLHREFALTEVFAAYGVSNSCGFCSERLEGQESLVNSI